MAQLHRNRMHTILATLAFLAMGFIGPAEAGMAVTTCSAIRGCSECLGTRDCAWYVGSNAIGCVAKDDCEEMAEDDSNRAECFRGTDDLNGGNQAAHENNEKICALTCSAEIFFSTNKRNYDRGCSRCNKYNYEPEDSSKGRCAWLDRPGTNSICIHEDRCGERQFEGARCKRVRRDADIQKRCKKSVFENRKKLKKWDHCMKNKSCKTCLTSGYGTNCAWFVPEGGTSKRGEAKCVNEGLCDDTKGSCTKSSATFQPRTQCNVLKAEVVIDDPNPPCSSFKGLCTKCLRKGGCRWNNANNECETDGDEDELTGRRRLGQQGDRQLDNIFGELEAEDQCVRHKLVRTNEALCSEAVQNPDNDKDPCEACVETQLYVPQGEYHQRAPTCAYINRSCVPSSHERTGTTCASRQGDSGVLPPGDADNFATPPPTYKRLNKQGYTEFTAECTNARVSVCMENVAANYGAEAGLDFEIVTPSMVDTLTKDIKPKRVRLFVDRENDPQTIINPMPRTG